MRAGKGKKKMGRGRPYDADRRCRSLLWGVQGIRLGYPERAIYRKAKTLLGLTGGDIRLSGCDREVSQLTSQVTFMGIRVFARH
jgi:hypothetical protein